MDLRLHVQDPTSEADPRSGGPSPLPPPLAPQQLSPCPFFPAQITDHIADTNRLTEQRTQTSYSWEKEHGQHYHILSISICITFTWIIQDKKRPTVQRHCKSSLIQSTCIKEHFYRGRILGRNWDKNLKSFLLDIHSHLHNWTGEFDKLYILDLYFWQNITLTIRKTSTILDILSLAHKNTYKIGSINYGTIGYRIRISDSQKLSVALLCWWVDRQSEFYDQGQESKQRQKKHVPLHHFPRNGTKAVALHLFFDNITVQNDCQPLFQLFIMFSYSYTFTCFRSLLQQHCYCYLVLLLLPLPAIFTCASHVVVLYRLCRRLLSPKLRSLIRSHGGA